jgi:drug/metabolite transporter (DMT)-like permease
LSQLQEQAEMQQSITFYVPLILTAVGGLTYHVAQKTMPTDVSPLILLAAAFAIALTLCVLSIPWMEPASLRLRRSFNWSSLALGVSVVMIEAGYLIAYRSGWKLNRAALTSNVAVAILLIPLGTVLFQERVSLRMLVGTALCISGLVLLVR